MKGHEKGQVKMTDTLKRFQERMYTSAGLHDNQEVITIGFYHTIQASFLDHIPVFHLFSSFHHMEKVNQIHDEENSVKFSVLSFLILEILIAGSQTLNVGGNVTSPS